jgi:hypothetical protein
MPDRFDCSGQKLRQLEEENWRKVLEKDGFLETFSIFFYSKDSSEIITLRNVKIYNNIGGDAIEFLNN